MKDRYRYDTGCIIDQQTTEILTDRKTVTRLNKQERIIQRARKHQQAVIDALNDEIEKAETDELKQALIRISHRELEYE
jgi:hypothetical protein